MAVRVRLRATLVKELDGSLTEEISPESVQRELAGFRRRGKIDRDALPVEGDIVGGHYRLVRRLGEGMFGRVYVAERTDVPEHRVAMKVINRVVYAGRDVERELVMLAAAGHPNIVELKDHGVTPDYVWLTMPLYEGETLLQRIGRGTLELREAYDIFLPVARGVEALHARGLRHQDIKPENIYLANFAGQLHPVVLDLGVAVEKRASFAAGTALFGSPEQIAALGGIGDGGELTEKVDTYCLASTLLYSLVGEDLFPGAKARTPYDIVSAFETRETAPLHESALPDLTGRAREMLIESFSRWLTRDQEERPSTGEFASELYVLLEQEREAERIARRKIQRQKVALQQVRIALGALVLIAGSAGVYVYSKRKTIQLAAELERVKAEGAASFDKLDTCVAAHKLSQHETKECERERKEETDKHNRALSLAKADGERSNQSLAEQLTTANTKLHACEDDAEKIADERDSIKLTLTDEQAKWDEERRTLQEEKEEAERQRRTCQTDVETITRNHNACRQQLAACHDPYLSAPPPSGGSSPPPSGGTTPPAGGGQPPDSPYD